MTERKQIVITYLKARKDPVSLQDLSHSLEIPERSLRRWLSEWIVVGIVEKIGHTKNAKYLFKNKEEQFSYFSHASQIILQKISTPLYERPPVTYNAAWFDAYIPNETNYLSQDLQEKLIDAGLRSQAHEPAGTYAHEIYNRLLIDLSYNSSRLEGNTYSLLDTERLLLLGDVPEGKLNEEKVMLLNHKEAIRYLVDNAARLTTSLEIIQTLHYLLADTLVDWKHAGKVRDHGVRIGGSTYIPIESQRHLQKQLERILEKATTIINPYEQSLFLLIHLSYLQAFADVNKRTARLSANIPLIPRNLVPCSFNDIDRSDYMSAMIAIYELQEVAPLIDLYVYSYLRTCKTYDETVKDIKFDAIRVRYRQQRRAVEKEIILKQLKGIPMQTYIDQAFNSIIPSTDLHAVKEDTIEDLNRMNTISIAGLGVSQEEFLLWLNKKTNE